MTQTAITGISPSFIVRNVPPRTVCAASNSKTPTTLSAGSFPLKPEEGLNGPPNRLMHAAEKPIDLEGSGQ
jgi:hypothetical protein